MNEFSRVVAGCMSWGKWGKNFNTSQMTALIEYCVEIGISTFDHADIYGDYTTEKEFGAALTQASVDRSKIQIISKCGIQYVGESRDNSIKHYNYNKDYILWSVDKSLKDLQTDYLDVLLLHRPSPLMQNDDIATAVDQLLSNGKIKSFGVSNFTPSQLALIGKSVSIAINQIQCSLTHLDPLFDGTLDTAITHNIKSMAWSPLGDVFRTPSEKTQRITSVLEVLTKKYDATDDQLVLAWLMQHPAMIAPVVGTTNKERLKNAFHAQHIKLELEDWFSLLVASQGHKVP